MLDLVRLRQAIEIVARHPDYPGKQDAVRECLEELEDLLRRGVLTADKRADLAAILDAAEPPSQSEV